MPFQYTLTLSPNQQKAVAARPDVAEKRFLQWAASQGVTITDGPAFFPNRIELNATPNPEPLWNVSALDTPALEETRDTALRTELTSLLNALDNNTATTAQIRRALFLTMRFATRSFLTGE